MANKYRWIHCDNCGRNRLHEAHGLCKPCYNRGWRQAHREEVVAYKRQCRQEHREERAAYDRQYCREHREEKLAYHRRYKRGRYWADTQVRIGRNLRSRLGSAIQGGHRAGSAVRDLGCSIPELVTHFEGLFREGMTWANRGSWHIDHIVPLSKFDLTDREQLLDACHYTNLQPLWAAENVCKGAKSSEGRQ